MATLVIDSNVWIDCQVAGLLVPAVFGRLSDHLVVPDVFATDVEAGLVATIEALGAQPVGLPGRQVARLAELMAALPARRPGFVDLFAMVLAQHLRAVLVTGDAALRTLAYQSGIDVHGTLWLLDRLIEGGGLTSAGAAHALETMQEHGRRLPAVECDEHVKRWRTG